MKILLTGVTGYIGHRLLPVLIREGHEIYCCLRDISRMDDSFSGVENLHLLEVNFLEPESLKAIPKDIDAAYYLIHSMSASTDDFEELEAKCARNFVESLNDTNVRQVIYLSGIVNEKELSKHLGSRFAVETILSEGKFELTTLRAGIIVGSGSASFEIIRDLVEKLPVMVTPRWLNTRSQPIAIRNVIQYLVGVLGKEESYGNSYDIGGPEILTYKEMLLEMARIRGLKRFIFTLPVMTPRLSSYWLYFVTATSYKLAVNLVNSMKIEVICSNDNIKDIVDIELISYSDAIRLAFDKIEQEDVLSSWTDALSTDELEQGMDRLLKVPQHGCLTDKKSLKIADENSSLKKIWSIGGKNGWYYADWLWEIRGFLDKVFGGVGLRRGRKNPANIKSGETLDFWRVIVASKKEKRLLLYAEMKLPGEAWLEFQIVDDKLNQTATFRPKGVWGRVYWFTMLPFHHFIFNGMIRSLAHAQ